MFSNRRPFALGLVLLALSATGCNRGVPKQRPATITPSAIWAGGADGAYFDCTVGVPTNACFVWDEDGKLLMSGGFAVSGQNRPAHAEELRYRKLQGDRIVLESGLEMRRIL